MGFNTKGFNTKVTKDDTKDTKKTMGRNTKNTKARTKDTKISLCSFVNPLCPLC